MQADPRSTPSPRRPRPTRAPARLAQKSHGAPASRFERSLPDTEPVSAGRERDATVGVDFHDRAVEEDPQLQAALSGEHPEFPGPLRAAEPARLVVIGDCDLPPARRDVTEGQTHLTRSSEFELRADLHRVRGQIGQDLGRVLREGDALPPLVASSKPRQLRERLDSQLSVSAQAENARKGEYTPPAGTRRADLYPSPQDAPPLRIEHGVRGVEVLAATEVHREPLGLRSEAMVREVAHRVDDLRVGRNAEQPLVAQGEEVRALHHVGRALEEGSEIGPLTEIRRAVQEHASALFLDPAPQGHVPRLAVPPAEGVAKALQIAARTRRDHGICGVLDPAPQTILTGRDALALRRDARVENRRNAVVNHAAAGEDPVLVVAPGTRSQCNGKVLPADQILAHRMSPAHVSPLAGKGVVLEEQVVLAVEVDGPVGIVDPVRGAGQMVDGATRIGGRSLGSCRDARVGALEGAPMFEIELVHEHPGRPGPRRADGSGSGPGPGALSGSRCGSCNGRGGSERGPEARSALLAWRSPQRHDRGHTAARPEPP